MTSFQKGGPGDLTYPLAAAPAQSDLVNPNVTPNDHGLPVPLTPCDDGFAAELGEVIKVRADVEAGVWPSWFFEAHGVHPGVPMPLYDEGVTSPGAAADIVRMDMPIDLGRILIRWLNRNGYKMHAEIDGYTDFLCNPVSCLEQLGNVIEAALTAAFEAKYFFGRARPEEVLAQNMTHYAEGCPNHPSAPAGHSAVSGATAKFLELAFDLDDKALLVVRTSALHFGMYRTLAGVHFQTDNEAGFILGERIAEELMA